MVNEQDISSRRVRLLFLHTEIFECNFISSGFACFVSCGRLSATCHLHRQRKFTKRPYLIIEFQPANFFLLLNGWVPFSSYKSLKGIKHLFTINDQSARIAANPVFKTDLSLSQIAKDFKYSIKP
jgi:hypothetical protein